MFAFSLNYYSNNVKGKTEKEPNSMVPMGAVVAEGMAQDHDALPERENGPQPSFVVTAAKTPPSRFPSTDRLAKESEGANVLERHLNYFLLGAPKSRGTALTKIMVL